MSHGPTGRHDIIRQSLSIGDELALLVYDVCHPSVLAGQEERCRLKSECALTTFREESQRHPLLLRSAYV